MTQLFNRHGDERQRNAGSEIAPVYSYEAKCSRCGGLGGGEQWRHTGWTCYECAGSGRGKMVSEKLYTSEKLAKLNATAGKRLATKLAKAQAAAAVIASEAAIRRDAFEASYGDVLAYLRDRAGSDAFAASLMSQAERKASLTAAQIDCVRTRIAQDAERAALRAASDYVGAAKERIACDVTVERVSGFERARFNAYGSETVYIISMRDERGNVLVSKSSRFYAEKGDRLTIKATVKDHSEYRGERQTVIERVAVQ